MPLVGNGPAVCAYALDGRGLDPAWSRTKLNLLPPQRRGDGRMRNVVASTDPFQRSTRSVEGGGFFDLFFSEALAADGDALLTKHCGHPGFGDAEVGTDLLGRLAGIVILDDVIDVRRAQNALGTRGSTTGGWSRR
jgi:hypothetical protein